MKAWAVGGLGLALLAFMGWYWRAFVDGFLAFPLVIWLRLTLGDQGVAKLVRWLAALAVLGLAWELWNKHVRRRQRRTQHRLAEHYAACQACQQLPGVDEYCPVGQRLYRAYMRN